MTPCYCCAAPAAGYPLKEQDEEKEEEEEEKVGKTDPDRQSRRYSDQKDLQTLYRQFSLTDNSLASLVATTPVATRHSPVHKTLKLTDNSVA